MSHGSSGSNLNDGIWIPPRILVIWAAPFFTLTLLITTQIPDPMNLDRPATALDGGLSENFLRGCGKMRLTSKTRTIFTEDERAAAAVPKPDVPLAGIPRSKVNYAFLYSKANFTIRQGDRKFP